MRTNTLVTLPALALALASSLGAQQTQPVQPAQPPVQKTEALPIPAVGSMAPDFTIRGATANGVMTTPIRLSELRGNTVVLAFFPAARTRGCTVQMETYRDQYATLFAGGTQVVVLAVSTDADTTLASWAKEANFPMLFGSDSDLAVSTAYGSVRGKYSSRNLFVIAPDGRIAHRMTPFNVLSQDAYAELAAAVKASLQPGAGASGGAGAGAPQR